jgi:hypothetical protein
MFHLGDARGEIAIKMVSDDLVGATSIKIYQ